VIHKACDNLIVTEESIYFIDTSDGNKVCKSDKYGKNVQVLIDEESSNLQYENGNLYYEATEDNQLYRMETYANNKISKMIDEYYYYFVHEDTIYFLRDWFPYTYSIEEKKESLLYDDRIFGFTLGENTLYWLGYFDEEREGRGLFAYDIASVSLDGTDIKIICNYKQNQNMKFPLYYFDNYLYYGVMRYGEGDLELARVKSDGTDEEYLGEYLSK
jgi:hypothetical protein